MFPLLDILTIIASVSRTGESRTSRIMAISRSMPRWRCLSILLSDGAEKCISGMPLMRSDLILA